MTKATHKMTNKVRKRARTPEADIEESLEDPMNKQPRRSGRLRGSETATAVSSLSSFDPLSDQACDLPAYGRALNAVKCSRCDRHRSAKDLNAESVIKRSRKLLRSGLVHPALTCQKCNHQYCVSCGKVVKPEDLDSLPAGSDVKVAWCCYGGRHFLVWSFLCGTEFVPLPTTASEAARSTASATTLANTWKDRLRHTRQLAYSSSPIAASTASASSVPPAGSSGPQTKGTPIAWAKGVGYGGHEIGFPWSQPKKTPGPSRKATKALNQEMTALRQYLHILSTLLLPSAGHFDRANFGLLREMFERSPLMRQVSELLRGTSVEELTSHDNLFAGAVALMEFLVHGRSTVEHVCNPIVLFAPPQQLIHHTLHPALSSSGPGNNQQSTLPTWPPLRYSLAAIAEKCVPFLRMAAGLPKAQQVDRRSEVHLCGRFRQVSEAIEHVRSRVLVKLEPADDGAEDGGLPTAQAEAEKWLNNHQCEEAEDTILESFYFKDHLTKDKGNQGGARVKKLMQQLSDLHDNLPQGIFVRYSATHLGVLKVIIVGSEDTPYENGLFEFDMFCNSDFPNKPPEMQFITTGYGRVGFNPNLYNTGKVCLSLLGTWSGQSWDPARSTLLQVLVSIQGMILGTSEPWYNEPGREHKQDHAESKKYNESIHLATLQHALKYWLDFRLVRPKGAETEAPDPVLKTRRRSNFHGHFNAGSSQNADSSNAGAPKSTVALSSNSISSGSMFSVGLTSLMSNVSAPSTLDFPASVTPPSMTLMEDLDSILPVDHPLAPGMGTAEMQAMMQAYLQRKHSQTPPTRPEKDDMLWGELIRRYFTVHAIKIDAKAKAWAKESPRVSEQGRLLREEMCRHGFL